MKSDLLIGFNLFLIIQTFFTQSQGKFNSKRKYFNGDPDLTGDLRVFKKQLRIQEPQFRLYSSIIPRNYTLRIRPILGDGDGDTGRSWTAPGTVHILLDCKETTNNITLHSGVQIKESSVQVTLEPKGSQLKISKFTRDPEKEFFTILFDSPVLIANKSYRISMDFVAEIYTSGDTYRTGIYRSHYTEPISQETRYVATTQFQPFGARLAFPCFDEPELKSTFEVTIGRLASNYTAVSNTPLKSTVQNAEHKDWVWDTFERTVPMSTYLIAWIISDYKAVKAPPGIFDKPVQTLAPKHVIDAGYGNYSAKLVAQQLAFYETYFLAEYPLGKMDSAAMVDFTDSAMENWGLNIYSPTTLYYTKAEYREKDRESTSSVIAHELAHQWFGNLVTCKFWTDFWLNEGFASHVEYLAMKNTVPEFETEKTRLLTDMQYAMRFDVLENSHPVQLSKNVDPDSNKKISFMYPILYKKSAALIRMMEGFLTEKTLQIGLQKFLKKYSFQSVVQDDLFKVMTEQAHADHRLPRSVTIKEIMDTWTLQRGYPLLRVSAVNPGQVYVSQEKMIRKNGTKGGSSNKWYIPISVATKNSLKLAEGDTLPTFWMNTTTTMRNWKHNTSQWIILNSGATGYYRVLYDDHLTKLIQEQMTKNHTPFHHGTRSQFLDDQFTLAFEGYSQIEVALNATKYLGEEIEYTVWVPVIRHLRRLYHLLQGDGVILFQKYFEPILTQVFRVINYEQSPNETGNIILFRAELLEWACEIQHPTCVEYSIELWRDWKDDPEINRIPLDQRSLVYCTALKTEGIIDDFVFILQRQRFETSDNNKIWLMRAFFSCFNTSDTVIWGKLLNASFEIGSSETPETQKLITSVVILSIAENPFAREIVITFLENNIDTLIEHTGNPKLISGVISSLTTYYKSTEELNRVRKFIQKHSEKLNSVMDTLNSAVMFLERNIEWISLNRKRVHSWLTVNSNEVISK